MDARTERKVEFETEYTRVPVCPFCGAEQEDWWDGISGADEDWSASCDACGKDFFVSKHVSINFTTKEVRP